MESTTRPGQGGQPPLLSPAYKLNLAELTGLVEGVGPGARGASQLQIVSGEPEAIRPQKGTLLEFA